MRLIRYRGRHLFRRRRRRRPLAVATAAVMTASAPAAQAGVHVVRAGETLSAIATKYRKSVTVLVKANHLRNPNLIVVGQRLRIPGAATGATRIHVVRRGETLSTIAARHGSSVTRLVKLNKISNPNLIVVGQRLRVPAHSGAPAGRGPTTPPATSRYTVEASLQNQSVGHGVSPSLVKGLAWQESGWQQDVISSAGAVGVMQVMPDTATYVNRSLGGGDLKVRRMDDNVHLGVMYLRHMLRIMPSTKKALAAYYSGPGNVHRRLNSGQRRYAKNVLALRERFR